MRTILYSVGIYLLLTHLSCALPKSPSVSQMADLPYPFTTKFLELQNGVRIAYADEGTGNQTILFVHGLGSYYPAWKKNVAVFVENTVVLPLTCLVTARAARRTIQAPCVFMQE